MTTIQRYWQKVDKKGINECWLWTAQLTAKGYGIYRKTDKTRNSGYKVASAHRYAYELANGFIPQGKVIDHICFNRACVNPRHLRVLTPLENSLRENRKPITHCKNGHEFTTENTKYHSKIGGRVCIICMRIYQRRWMRDYRKSRKALA